MPDWRVVISSSCDSGTSEVLRRYHLSTAPSIIRTIIMGERID